MVLFVKKNFGFIVTSIWIIGIFLFWILGNLEKPKSLNELGDFLAGAFAPIAFLWLVLGYRQQGKQLEQNTKALEQQEKALQLQIEEMRESVRQQAKLVTLQREQLDQANNAVNPLFKFSNTKISCLGQGFENGEIIGPDYALIFNLINLGKEVRNLEILGRNDTKFSLIEVLPNDCEKKILIEMESINFAWHNNYLSGEFKIGFLNTFGQKKFQKFVVDIMYLNVQDYEIDQPIRTIIKQIEE